MDSTSIPSDTRSSEFHVCVCGGRDFNNRYEVWRFLDRLHAHRRITLLIHGDARGADRIAGAWAKWRRIPVKAVPADWNRFGKAAGPHRNAAMVKMRPHCLIAFPGGTGTANMISQCHEADINVHQVKLSYGMARFDGDIFDSTCEYIVNPVNSVGVMGKGLALEFRNRFPRACRDYNSTFKGPLRWIAFKGSQIEDLAVPFLSKKKGERGICFFPTKIDWRDPSRYEYVEHSLKILRSLLDKHNVHSIAFPEVGCGEGGLEWDRVEQLIYKHMSGYKGYIEFYHKINAERFVL
jgi:O-acetyl-ADP-ribose deacetylase (regulator of RNase III)